MAFRKAWFFLLLITSPVSMKEKKLVKTRSCLVGWVRNGDKCYFIDDTPTSKQADARAPCQNKGGDLTIIKSEEENEFIRHLVLQQDIVTHFGVWLGFQRKQTDSKFYWINGTPLERGYTNWGPNEPDNYKNIEDCGVMYGNDSGTWNDYPCTVRSSLSSNPVILCQNPL